MQEYKIPTAEFKTFVKDEYSAAAEYLNKVELPIVLKASGLAAGKGVIIVHNYETLWTFS